MKNTTLTKKEKAEFSNLFKKYCQSEMLNGRCEGNYACEMCIISKSYRKIFPNTSMLNIKKGDA